MNLVISKEIGECEVKLVGANGLKLSLIGNLGRVIL